MDPTPFIDGAQLTSYENEGHQEAYVYNAENDKMICVSCGPSDGLETATPAEDDAQLIDRCSLLSTRCRGSALDFPVCVDAETT